MPTLKKKVVTVQTPSPLPATLSVAQQFTAMLKDITDQISTMATDKLTEMVAAMKPVEKVVSEMNGATRKELIDRVLADDPHFLRVGNQSLVDVGDLTVSLRRNEKLVEVPGGLAWLRLHHGSQYAILTKRELRVSDPVAVGQVVDDLLALIKKSTKGRLRITDIQPLVAQLDAVVERTDRLDQKAVEKAVKNGSLTDDDVKRLYQLEGDGDPTYKPSFTLNVTPRKAAEETDGRN